MKTKTIASIILLCVVLSMGCTEAPVELITEPTEIPTSIPLSERSVAKYDFEWSSYHTIDYSTAPTGYKYAVVTYRVKNDGYNVISTNPHYWAFYANGVTYSYDSISHSDLVNTLSVDVSHGGDITTDIAFLIPNNINSGRLEYKPWYGDDIIYRDNSLISDVEPTPWPTPTPRRPKQIPELTLDDNGFLQWYDNQKIYYSALYYSHLYMNFEDSQNESNKSLIQIDKFQLSDEKHISLRDNFKIFLERLNNMDEKEFHSIYDDHHSSSAEQGLNKYWQLCINKRHLI